MERVFEVVEDGQRLMTSEDLEFVDEDIDTRWTKFKITSVSRNLTANQTYMHSNFRPEDIHYNNHAIPNGDFFFVSDVSKPIFKVS